MKILMVNVPFSGHVNPTLALASELTKRGHSVSYILTKDWKERIEDKMRKKSYIGNLWRHLPMLRESR